MADLRKTPDFDQIARAALHRWGQDDAPIQRTMIEEDIAEQLRQAWNDRGVADLAALEPIIENLGDTMDPDNARVFVEHTLHIIDR